MGDTGAGAEIRDDLACPGGTETRIHIHTVPSQNREGGDLCACVFCLLSLYVYGVIFCYYFCFFDSDIN